MVNHPNRSKKRNASASSDVDLHARLQMDEHAAILRQCEASEMDMTICGDMPFKTLRDMWSDYQATVAAMGE